MLIAQITDLHLGFDGPEAEDKNAERFNQVLAHLQALSVKPDVLLITGDLIETGNNWAYRRVKSLAESLRIPVFFAMGNHDNRDGFETVFQTGLMNNGFLQYTIEDFDLRIIVLDTLQPGWHGAGFCETRADWLSAKLAEQPSRPTLIAMHHPPIETGIGWLTASPDDDWVKRFKSSIEGHENIVQILAGHIHRNIIQKFGSTNVIVSHAVAPRAVLDLAPIDVDKPDNRPLLSDGTGGYSLHQWNGSHLTTHIVQLPIGMPIVKYDKEHAWIVRHTLDLKNKANV